MTGYCIDATGSRKKESAYERACYVSERWQTWAAAREGGDEASQKWALPGGQGNRRTGLETIEARKTDGTEYRKWVPRGRRGGQGKIGFATENAKELNSYKRQINRLLEIAELVSAEIGKALKGTKYDNEHFLLELAGMKPDEQHKRIAKLRITGKG